MHDCAKHVHTEGRVKRQRLVLSIVWKLSVKQTIHTLDERCVSGDVSMIANVSIY